MTQIIWVAKRAVQNLFPCVALRRIGRSSKTPQVVIGLTDHDKRTLQVLMIANSVDLIRCSRAGLLLSGCKTANSESAIECYRKAETEHTSPLNGDELLKAVIVAEKSGILINFAEVLEEVRHGRVRASQALLDHIHMALLDEINGIYGQQNLTNEPFASGTVHKLPLMARIMGRLRMIEHKLLPPKQKH